MPDKTKLSDKKSVRDGEVRCLKCFERFRIPRGSEKMSCPNCQMEWRISWPYPQTAKIKGPVWNKMPR